MASALSQEHLRETLREVIQARGESLREFGAALARTINPNAQPFSKTYIIALRDGKREITAEIAQAIHVLAAMLDGQTELQARAHKVTCYAIHDLSPTTIILGKERRCKLPGCMVTFVPSTPSQRYCSPECRREMKRRREQQRE